ncbi:hypothetical protein BJ912DRAFT_1148526, partial [Pholiota molesta]
AFYPTSPPNHRPQITHHTQSWTPSSPSPSPLPPPLLSRRLPIRRRAETVGTRTASCLGPRGSPLTRRPRVAAGTLTAWLLELVPRKDQFH